MTHLDLLTYCIVKVKARLSADKQGSSLHQLSILLHLLHPLAMCWFSNCMLLNSFAHFTSDFITGHQWLYWPAKHMFQPSLAHFSHFLCIVKNMLYCIYMYKLGQNTGNEKLLGAILALVTFSLSLDARHCFKMDNLCQGLIPRISLTPTKLQMKSFITEELCLAVWYPLNPQLIISVFPLFWQSLVYMQRQVKFVSVLADK